MDDDRIDSIPISALNHFGYCPRSCGLILVEGLFAHNEFVIEGEIGHTRSDRGGVGAGRRNIVYDVDVWSDVHGLIGKVDAVERRCHDLIPLEYKRGAHATPGNEMQVAAEAL